MPHDVYESMGLIGLTYSCLTNAASLDPTGQRAALSQNLMMLVDIMKPWSPLYVEKTK